MPKQRNQHGSKEPASQATAPSSASRTRADKTPAKGAVRPARQRAALWPKWPRVPKQSKPQMRGPWQKPKEAEPCVGAAVSDLEGHHVIPTAWRQQLFSQYADDTFIPLLFTLSKDGRDWALRYSSGVTIQIEQPTEDDTSLRSWQVKSRTIEEAFRTRGELPTCLKLVYHDGRLLFTSLGQLPRQLQGAYVTELQVLPCNATAIKDSLYMSAFVKQAAKAFTHLTTLQVNASKVVLPAPHLLPNLTSLKLDTEHSDAALYRSITPYMPQLQALELVSTEDETTHPVGLLFPGKSTATNAAPKLAKLTTSATLDDHFLSLLLRHAPSLAHLKVRNIESRLIRHMEQYWNVHTLEFDMANAYLHHLPKRHEGRLKLVSENRGAIAFSVDVEQGFDDGVVARLTDFDFATGCIVLKPLPTQHDGLVHHTPALRLALDALSADKTVADHVRNTKIQLKDFEWTEQMLGSVTIAGTHRGFQFELASKGPFDDLMLLVGQRLTPYVRSVTAESLKMAAWMDPTHNPWPFDEVNLDRVDVPSLVMLWPVRQGNAAPVTMRFKSMDFHRIKQAPVRGRAEELVRWMPKVIWEPYPGCKHVTMTLAPPKRTEDLPTMEKLMQAEADLLAQLSVLQSVRLAGSETERCVTVKITGSLSLELLYAMKKMLPAWASTIDLSSCDMCLPSTTYRTLAAHIPTSYTAWRLHNHPSSHTARCIMAGIEEQRKGLGLPRLKLVMPKHKGPDVRLGEHVIVSSCA